MERAPDPIWRPLEPAIQMTYSETVLGIFRMSNDRDLSEILKRYFYNYYRQLKRQLDEIEGNNAKTHSSNSVETQTIAELERRVSNAKKYEDDVLMRTRKGTFGKALSPICPRCLIDHDMEIYLDEFGNRFKCPNCDLNLEAES